MGLLRIQLRHFADAFRGAAPQEREEEKQQEGVREMEEEGVGVDAVVKCDDVDVDRCIETSLSYILSISNTLIFISSESESSSFNSI